MTRVVIGVMGPGAQATPAHCALAYDLGQAIAEAGWVLLTGGRNVGVMAAANRGAKAGGGLTVGILPDREGRQMSSDVDIPILTGLGDGRNTINILSSQVIIACGLGAGTASEIALAIKAQKPLILLKSDPLALAFWQQLSPTAVLAVESVAEAIILVHHFLRTP